MDGVRGLCWETECVCGGGELTVARTALMTTKISVAVKAITLYSVCSV